MSQYVTSKAKSQRYTVASALLPWIAMLGGPSGSPVQGQGLAKPALEPRWMGLLWAHQARPDGCP